MGITIIATPLARLLAPQADTMYVIQAASVLKPAGTKSKSVLTIGA